MMRSRDLYRLFLALGLVALLLPTAAAQRGRRGPGPDAPGDGPGKGQMQKLLEGLGADKLPPEARRALGGFLRQMDPDQRRQLMQRLMRRHEFEREDFAL